MELTVEQTKTLQAAATESLAAQNDRLREIIHEALLALVDQDRPTTYIIRDATAALRRA